MLKTDSEGNIIDPLGDQRAAGGHGRWFDGDLVYWRGPGGGWRCGEVAEAADVLRVLEAATGRLWQLSEDEVLRNYPREGDE